MKIIENNELSCSRKVAWLAGNLEIIEKIIEIMSRWFVYHQKKTWSIVAMDFETRAFIISCWICSHQLVLYRERLSCEGYPECRKSWKGRMKIKSTQSMLSVELRLWPTVWVFCWMTAWTLLAALKLSWDIARHFECSSIKRSSLS